MVKSTTARSIAYALRELGRRAGASPEWIARWRVEIAPHAVVVHPGGDHTIAFAFDASKPQRPLDLLQVRAPAFGWMDGIAPPTDRIGTFVVPFDDGPGGGALFARTSQNGVVCRADLITATLWTLTRYEERCSAARDEHGRFPANASVAHRLGFLERPIVDEYGLAFAQALQSLFPAWSPRPNALHVKISHDIDLVGLPRRARTIAGHLYARRSLRAFARDAASAIAGGSTAYLDAALELARLSREHGLTSAFYWMAATRATAYDSGYDPRHPLVRGVVERLAKDGAEIGIHPGYDTFSDEARLHAEIARLREAAGDRTLGGRQHYLRWEPSTWLAWERAGLVYDSTLGFADAVGFRAGTAHPYHPWSLEEDRELALLEIPLVVMDCTPIAYMRLTEEEALARVRALLSRSRIAGGAFTLLWHNTSLIEPPYGRLYPKLLRAFDGLPSYDWTGDRAIAPLPQLAAIASAR